MKPEEYDEFLYDPSDFIVRKYWPRAYGKLTGLAELLPLREAHGYFASRDGGLHQGVWRVARPSAGAGGLG